MAHTKTRKKHKFANTNWHGLYIFDEIFTINQLVGRILYINPYGILIKSLLKAGEGSHTQYTMLGSVAIGSPSKVPVAEPDSPQPKNLGRFVLGGGCPGFSDFGLQNTRKVSVHHKLEIRDGVFLVRNISGTRKFKTKSLPFNLRSFFFGGDMDVSKNRG